MEMFQNGLRTIMFFLDNIIYGLIPQIYKLFIYLSELNLFSEDPNSPIQRLVNHIYVLLGIFMLFKVSFSLLQYIVDPNSFRDSSKGMGKLVTNVLVALVLLVSVPSIFNLAMNIQTEIVQSNAIGQLILGTSAGSDSYPVNKNGSINDEGIEQMARDLQFMLYGAFYSINPTVMEEGRILEDCSGSSGVLGSTDMATTDCLNSLQDNLPDDATSNDVNLYSFFKYQDSNGEIQDERDFFHFDKLLWWKDEGVYVINYLPFISAVAGIYVAFLLISFCVDIAVRAIKLCFLQMLAPIAIVSYVDPKESISNGKLNAWIKECASTYFSLFLRLATIFLVMFLISMISSTLLSDGGYISGMPEDTSYNIWIYLFLVIGAFMFAKQVPKIIESIFGIKGSGELSLNPFKTFASARDSGFGAAVGLTAGAIGGAAIGGIGNTVANVMKNRDLKQKLEDGKISKEVFNAQYRKPLNLAGSAVAGFGAGAFRSAVVGAKSKNPLSGISQGVKLSSDKRRARAAGYGALQNTKDRFAEMVGIESDMGTTDAIKSKIKELRIKMANAQRDESAASYQMQNLMSRDPNVAQSMREAFSEDGNGNLKYDDYNAFIAKNLENYGGGNLRSEFNEYYDKLKQKQQAGEDTSEELKQIDSLVDLVRENNPSLLKRQDYNNYDSARKARNDADDLAKKYEKEISQLEETKGFQAHLKGKK